MLRTGTLAFVALTVLTGCSTQMKVSNSAPYDDINEVPDRRFVQTYFKHLVANHWETLSQNEILVCGAVKSPGRQKFRPGLTIENALRDAQFSGGQWVPSFYNVALWRASEGAFYGVRFADSPYAKPKTPTLPSTTTLEPGDAVIALEKMLAF